MEPELIEGGNEAQIWWISKPRDSEIGLKVAVDFSGYCIRLKEEDIDGNIYNDILMSFDEVDTISQIVRRRYRPKITKVKGG